MDARRDVLCCRNFLAGTCPKSDPIVLQEDSEYLQVGCKTCHSGRVVTLPTGRAKARYENRAAELKRLEKQERDRQQRTVIFT